MTGKLPSLADRCTSHTSRSLLQLFCLCTPKKVSAVMAVAGLLSALFADQVASQDIRPLSDARWESMIGKSWHPGHGCPERSDLRELRVTFNSFSGDLRAGSLIVERQSAPALARTFRKLLDCNFRIERIDPVDEFDGDDEKSMAANNTSAFNCRMVDGTTRISAHAAGAAIDINPVQNPQVRGGLTTPRAGASYDSPEKRTEAVTGIILPNSCVVRAFSAIGWKWGGQWKSLKDYQHFSRTGK
jgi:poly-gamma-glutamate synthesis protein (capsule biosynthesis protein)